MRAPKTRPKVIGSASKKTVSDETTENDSGCSLPSNRGACECFDALGSAR